MIFQLLFNYVSIKKLEKFFKNQAQVFDTRHHIVLKCGVLKRAAAAAELYKAISRQFCGHQN